MAPSAATRGLAASLRAEPVAPRGADADDKTERERRGLPRRLDPERWRGGFVGRAGALTRLHNGPWRGDGYVLISYVQYRIATLISTIAERIISFRTSSRKVPVVTSLIRRVKGLFFSNGTLALASA